MKFLLSAFVSVVSFCIVTAIAMGVGLALYAASIMPNLPTVDEIRQIPLNIPLRIYSNDNKLIAEYGDERRIPISIDQAPPLLIDAILVSEDDRFYHHTGVDFPGLVRAALSNFSSGSKQQGASTITMQVVRNFFLNPEKTYTRKLKEIILSFNMERALTKDEILELYLNKIFLGHRAYGFAAAAQVYYGEDLADLSLPEIAMLAGLPKAPSSHNPISNPKRAAERRNYVLKRLHELDKIDDFSYEAAMKAPLTATRNIAKVDVKAPYIAEMARQSMTERFGTDVYKMGLSVTLTVNSRYQAQASHSLRKGLIEYDMRHGFKGPIGKFDNAQLESLNKQDADQVVSDYLSQFPSSGEINPAIVTSVDSEQFIARTDKEIAIAIPLEHVTWARSHLGPNSLGPEIVSVEDVLSRGDTVYIRQIEEDSWGLSQLPEVSGALVSLDPHTGAVLALSGGFDYYLSKFNRATQAQRQPGSNIKPFIYSAAIDKGFTPSTRVSAAPIVIEDDLEGIWRPQNYSKKFFGPTRLRKALSLSLNLVSVRLLRSIGIDNTIDHLSRFGFDPDSLPRTLSLALGSTTTTTLELASYYSALANGGTRVKPNFVQQIVDSSGNEISLNGGAALSCETCLGSGSIPEDTLDLQTDTESEEADTPPERVISAQNAFLTTSIMKQVILTGTGRRALALGRNDLAGKTGTTNDYRDAWFSGFSPDVMSSVYIGFDEPSHLGRRESGASAALPIWVDYMGEVLKDFPEKNLHVPSKITTRFINKDTEKVTYPTDPDGYHEYYLVGTEPNNTVEQAPKGTEKKPEHAVSETLF
ncbi:MAG: PBP1A family penicillin-binding protein [Gammaproteobacteria bacterium]|nr:PBP1A family penicillin-binding protein [Gammaproteobacteria bacterium]